MTAQTLTVGLVQQSCTASNADNLQTTITAIHAAAQQGAQLVLLQELHRSLYFCQQENSAYFDLAETVPGPTTAALGKIAKELNLVIVTSVFERRGPGLYHNTAVVLESNGDIAGRYRKMHIPDDPGYYEKYYFTPGDLGFTPVNTSLGRLGVLICWDQWFPEAARLMALAGADLLLYPTAIGWDPRDSAAEQQRQLDAWMTIQRSHAISNGLPVLACNRCGFEADPGGHSDGIEFWGSSFISGPQGEILVHAGQQASTLVTTLDLAHSEQVRRSWPYLRDRRIDAYGDLTLRFRDEALPSAEPDC